jgi:hypothetical protein
MGFILTPVPNEAVHIWHDIYPWPTPESLEFRGRLYAGSTAELFE